MGKEKVKVSFRTQGTASRTHRLQDWCLSVESAQGRRTSPPTVWWSSGQDDLLDHSVVFWNIPIHGAVGVIFLESPNMGRIPQTLKLSHPA